MKKRNFIFSILLCIGCLFIWFSFNLCRMSPDNRLKDLHFKSQYKSIFFISNTNSCYNIMLQGIAMDSLNCSLSSIKEEDIREYFQKYSNDTIFLCGNNNISGIMLPILENDSCHFSNSFSIDIYDKDLKILYKRVNLDEFKKYAKSNYKAGNSFFSAREWTLHIDSLLLVK